VSILSGKMKRSIMARIGNLNLGDEVQVSSTLPAEPDRKCVYGGRVRWAQREITDMKGVVFVQTITFEVRVRVFDLGDDVDGVEAEAERIISAVADGVVALPSLVGTAGTLVASAGDQDPTMLSPGPEPSVAANFSVTFVVTVTTGGR
jgi:hypothetical protein